MLEWKFDVERLGVILGHNVEYTGSMSRLPILVLECSKGGHLEGGGHAKQDWKVAFWGEKMDEMAWNFHGTIPASRSIISTWLHPPGPPVPCTGMQKNRVWVERFRCLWIWSVYSACFYVVDRSFNCHPAVVLVTTAAHQLKCARFIQIPLKLTIL